MTVSINPGEGSSFTATKIAFNRVPKAGELEDEASLSAAHFAKASKAKTATKDGRDPKH